MQHSAACRALRQRPRAAEAHRPGSTALWAAARCSRQGHDEVERGRGDGGATSIEAEPYERAARRYLELDEGRSAPQASVGARVRDAPGQLPEERGEYRKRDPRRAPPDVRSKDWCDDL